MTTNTIQQYDSHQQTIDALLDDIRVAAAFHKQACGSASNHTPAFLFEIKMVEDALREALAYLTGEDNWLPTEVSTAAYWINLRKTLKEQLTERQLRQNEYNRWTRAGFDIAEAVRRADAAVAAKRASIPEAVAKPDAVEKTS